MFPEDNRLLIVDGHAYAYRSFHAIRNLSAPNGVPTNAIFGFIKSIGKLQAILKPEYVLVAWDGGLASERLKVLPDYKAQRPPMPDALEQQLPGIRQYLAAAGISEYQGEGIEADDWIAGVTRRAVEQAANVIIASSDKDFQQLVGDRVGLFNPNDKTDKIWTAGDVVEKTGVTPGQIVEYLSLMGDAVDNIPGVQGVGPKTAGELLRQFGTVNALFTNLEGIKSEKLRNALAMSKELVLKNMELIRLRDHAPEELEVNRLKPGRSDVKRLRELFTQWGFTSMARDLPQNALGQGELF